MKKQIIILLIAIFSIVSVFSYTELKQKDFVVEGSIGKYHLLYITPIESDFNETSGSSFNLLNEAGTASAADIMYRTGTGNGRIVSHWSVSSNYCPITISFIATDLAIAGNVDDETIPYYIDFHYRYAIYEADDAAGIVVTESAAEGNFRVSSGGTEQSITLPLNSTITYPISFTDQPITLMLKEDIDPISNQYVNGIYTATVTVVLEGE